MQISLTKPRTPKNRKLSFSECLNQHAKDEFVYTSVEEHTRGLTFKEALALAKPETDRATSPARVNPASDALLVNLVDKMPSDLVNMTKGALNRWMKSGDSTPETLQQDLVGYKIGEQAPLDFEPLVETLEAVIQEYPQYQPHIGDEHVWSPESKAGFGINVPARAMMALKGERPFPVPIFGSKLISALGLGATSVVMPTGKEMELESWVLAQEDRSVQLHELFGEAYRLHKGDLYGTMLCAENVLSEGLYTPDRQDREVTRKLSYLRSDSAPTGDNFGAWYHLFGSALYRMMRPAWKAHTVIKIEDVGSRILEGADAQESHINALGLKLGRELKRMAEQGVDGNATQSPYVNTREFDWDRSSEPAVPSPVAPPLEDMSEVAGNLNEWKLAKVHL